MITFNISNLEKEALRTLVSGLARCDLNQPKAFEKVAARLNPILIPELNNKLRELRFKRIDSVFLTNLPVFSGESGEHNTMALSLLISCMIGSPFQYSQQNHGQIVAKVTPEKGFESSHSSSGRMKFGWHSDDSFVDEQFRTDFILLAGFHNPLHVKTQISGIDEITSRIQCKDVFELMKPLFSIGVPASFKLNKDARINQVPVLWMDGSRKLNVAVSEYNVNAHTDKGKAALNEFFKSAEQVAESIDLQAGTFLIFNNNRFLHSRGEIKGERTVFRTYIKESLKHFEELESAGNVFDLHQVFKKMAFQTVN